MAKQQGFSLRRENAVEGGGQVGTLAEIGFVQEFTYGGRYKDKPSCALRTVYKIDGLKEPWEDHWPIGPSDAFEVSDDGYSVRPVGKKTGLNKNSAGYFFFDALQTAIEESGLDVDELLPEEDGVPSVEPLEGIRVEFTNKPFTNVSGDTRDKKVVGTILADEPAAKSNGKATSKKSSGDDVAEKTVAAIKSLLEDNTRIKKSDLPNLIYAENKKDVDAKAMMQQSMKDVWLASLEDEGIAFDKKKGFITAAE